VLVGVEARFVPVVAKEANYYELLMSTFDLVKLWSAGERDRETSTFSN